MEVDINTIQAKFISSDNSLDSSEELPIVDLPIDVDAKQLELICNALLKNEEQTPYLFFLNDEEIKTTLKEAIATKAVDLENIVNIIYQPQAVFRVRKVTRCTSSMPGHAEAVVALSFSPDSTHLASGSGDTTLRLWDLTTETPKFTCTGHKNWVLVVSWSPDSKKIASACKSGELKIWDPETGKQIGRTMSGHKKWINCLSWEPFHLNPDCRRIASAGHDNDVRIWDVVLGSCVRVLSGHTAAITAVRWGGSGLIFTSSKDRTCKMYRAEDGTLCRTFSGHAHWVNNLTLNTDYVLKTGPFHPVLDRKKSLKLQDKEELRKLAFERFQKICNDGIESFVSCSDDFTLYLWRSDNKQCIARMTGHQNVVNDVKYSPDVRTIASASFDKSVRLWRASDGGFIAVLRGHVQAVYCVAWSADSRLLVSSSKDSTLKVWNLKTKKLEQELPGHADEVFAVDWSLDGSRVASGGKDKVLKIWAY